jgi:hypothetical protein
VEECSFRSNARLTSLHFPNLRWRKDFPTKASKSRINNYFPQLSEKREVRRILSPGALELIYLLPLYPDRPSRKRPGRPDLLVPGPGLRMPRKVLPKAEGPGRKTSLSFGELPTSSLYLRHLTVRSQRATLQWFLPPLFENEQHSYGFC